MSPVAALLRLGLTPADLDVAPEGKGLPVRLLDALKAESSPPRRLESRSGDASVLINRRFRGLTEALGESVWARDIEEM